MEIKAMFVRLDTADVKARKIRQTRNQTSRTTGFSGEVPSFSV